MVKILIGSSDFSVLEVLAATLEGQGFEVILTEDGHEAFSRGVAEQPDLALLDVSMPIFDGFEVCSMLRNDPDVPPRMPIYLLTSIEDDPRLLEKAGATGYCPKSIPAGGLLELVVAALGPKAGG